MENIKISAIIDSYDELNNWIREVDYLEWITKEGMYFQIKNNNIAGGLVRIMVENYNIRYIESNNSIYLFDEPYHYAIEDEYIKQLINYGYHLNS